MRRVWNRLFDWTGFRGKTLWDLLGLLIVPLFIAGATLVFSILESMREQERALVQLQIEDQRAKAQQQIEDQRAQDNVLQSYIEDMTTLLLDKGLATSKQNEPVRSIARSSTLTALRQLDGNRKAMLLRFLSESNLIGTAIFNPETKNITYPDALIYLGFADLSHADLRRAFLRSADLSGANLSGAFLDGADLSGAKGWTNEQLAQAESLVEATLPDGTKMTEEAWEEFKKQYRVGS
jgi:hypothetical protein